MTPLVPEQYTAKYSSPNSLPVMLNSRLATVVMSTWMKFTSFLGVELRLSS